MPRVWRFRRYDRFCRIVLSTAVFFTLFGSFFLLKMHNVDKRDFVGSIQNGQDGVMTNRSSSDCACYDDSTSQYFNFCYHLPDKYGIRSIGKKFSCDHLPIIRRLGLLDTNLDEYFRFDRYGRGGPIIPDYPPIVTAASHYYFRLALALIKTLQKHTPKHKRRIIFYDLGLDDADIKTLMKLCGVEVRRFDFSIYPNWVKSLREYRWKPILIAESVKEFGVIWYMDASVQLENSNLSYIHALLNCRASFAQMNGSNSSPFGNVSLTHRNTSISLDDSKLAEPGIRTDSWTDSVRRCDKFAYMLHGLTRHGIFSATNPGVYEYIPSDVERLKRERCEMYEAGYVLCALEKDCMAPPGSSLACSFKSDRYSTYANCHRFDQSVVNLLLANRNYFDNYYWISYSQRFFNVLRGSGAVVEMDRNALLEECL